MRAVALPAAALAAPFMLAMAAPAGAAERSPAGVSDVASMYDFAACVVNRSRSGVEEVLALDFREEAYSEAIRRLARGNAGCLGSDMEIAGVLLAGSLAEVLLRRDYTQPGLSEALRPPASPFVARNALEQSALCMALRRPQETSALLFSTPGGEDAAALIGAYAQGLPECVARGRQMTFNSLGLRALAALAAYRIANGADAAGKAG